MAINLYNRDCMASMAEMPDKAYDLAIVDPPYFTGPEKRIFYGCKISNRNVKRRDYKPLSKTWMIPDVNYFKELIRVSKNQIIWGYNYFDVFLGGGSIIWDKINHGSSFSDCEIAFCSFHNSVRLFRFMWNGMIQGKSISEPYLQKGNKKENQKRIHPTEKPIELYKWLLKNYAKPGDRILDTHLGSGSIAIACHDMGFDLDGFEIDKDYFEAAKKRFDIHIGTTGQSLFKTPQPTSKQLSIHE